MNQDSPPLHVLRTLILKAQSESLTVSETDQLNDLIQSEDGAKEAASLIDQLCAFTDSGSLESLPMTEMLSQTLGSDAPADGKSTNTVLSNTTTTRQETIDTTLPTASSMASHVDAHGTNNSHRMSILWLLVIAASHLGVASLAWSWAKSSSIQNPTSNVALETSPRIDSDSVHLVSASPQLVSMTACIWQPSGDTTPTLGESLQSGEILSLVEGIAELRIGEGTSGEALVRIEGPASVHIRPDDQLGLLQGSMTAKSIGIGSQVVSVITPIGNVIIDGQTSAGLVSNGSVNEVHVFSGQARVELHQGTSPNEIYLEDAEAVRISVNSTDGSSVVKFEASEADFVSARSPGFDPLDLGEAYTDAIANSQPCIYWRFEELKGEFPPYVENQGSAPGMNAVVVGEPEWRQYGSNRVAELGMGTSSAFRALEQWPEKPLEEYAIEMWVKPLLFHHGEVLCLHDPKELADGRHQHTMMFEVTAQHYFTHRLTDSPANRFRFVHRRLGSPQPISVTSLFAEQEYRARTWQHVVLQKQRNRQMIWVDGQLSAERENPEPLAENVSILIGQVYPNSVYRRFVGQLDEVAIYDRCLSPIEMRKHIRAAGHRVALKTESP